MSDGYNGTTSDKTDFIEQNNAFTSMYGSMIRKCDTSCTTQTSVNTTGIYWLKSPSRARNLSELWYCWYAIVSDPRLITIGFYLISQSRWLKSKTRREWVGMEMRWTWEVYVASSPILSKRQSGHGRQNNCKRKVQEKFH